MAELAEREVLVASLRGYLEELLDTGVTELIFGGESSVEPPAPVAAAAQRGTVAAAAEGAAAPASSVPEALPPLLRGFGNPAARLVFVMTGDGFQGEAGELLAKMVQAMKFSTDEVYLIAFREETPPSRSSLLAALHKTGAEAVVTLGEPAAQLLLQTEAPLADLRGAFSAWEGAPVMPTWHPGALLSNQALKRDAWNDLQQVMHRLGK